jgi:hypothetical protein
MSSSCSAGATRQKAPRSGSYKAKTGFQPLGIAEAFTATEAVCERMWLLRILTCFAYARRTSWPDRPTDSTCAAPSSYVLLLHSAQLGGDLAPTWSAGHCPRWSPCARMVRGRNLRGQTTFAKGLGESPRTRGRSVPQVSNGSDAQNAARVGGFFIGTTFPPYY